MSTVEAYSAAMASFTARLKLQCATSLSSVITALLWRGVRRPLLRLVAPFLCRLIPAHSSAHSPWVWPVIRMAAGPDQLARLTILNSDATLFGYAISGPLATILGSDQRFRHEMMRAQSIHPLLTSLWRSEEPVAGKADIERRITADLEAALTVEDGHPMDVALRALSIVMVLEAEGAGRLVLPDEFLVRLKTSLKRAIVVCYCDPEYSGRLSNNHHLTTVGLLYVMTSGMSESRVARAIRNTAWTWVVRATRHQFQPDGSQFENAMGYHMCCLEVLSLVVLARRAQSRDGWIVQPTDDEAVVMHALRKARDFARGVSRPDGSFPLIGDFDGSRMIRLHARYFDLMTDHASQTLLFDDSKGRTHRIAITRLESASGPEAVFLAGLALGDDTPGPSPVVAAAGPDSRFLNSLSAALRSRAVTEPDIAAIRGVETGAFADGELTVHMADMGAAYARFDTVTYFQDAGILVARAGSLHITMRDGCVGQLGMGTHTHLDHLAIDLWIDGKSAIADPGTWVYRASSAGRNRYRGLRAHFSPLAGFFDEESSQHHPFMLDRPPERAMLFSSEDAIWGTWRSEGRFALRHVRLVGSQAVITDSVSSSGGVERLFESPLTVGDAYFGRMRLRDSQRSGRADLAQ